MVAAIFAKRIDGSKVCRRARTYVHRETTHARKRQRILLRAFDRQSHHTNTNMYKHIMVALLTSAHTLTLVGSPIAFQNPDVFLIDADRIYIIQSCLCVTLHYVLPTVSFISPYHIVYRHFSDEMS